MDTKIYVKLSFYESGICLLTIFKLKKNSFQIWKYCKNFGIKKLKLFVVYIKKVYFWVLIWIQKEKEFRLNSWIGINILIENKSIFDTEFF